MSKNYSGSDLSKEWKSFARKEMNRIHTILSKLGCTNVEKSYGFHYFIIVFTSPSGQTYYMSSGDTRGLSMLDGYKNLMYRTTKHYKDWTGGSNNYVDKNEIENIRLM